MIIIRLANGLGDQMFQYALGRHLALKNKAVLKLDLSKFKNYESMLKTDKIKEDTFRFCHYSLDLFNIEQNFSSPEELTALIKPPQENRAEIFGKKILRKGAGLTRKIYANHDNKLTDILIQISQPEKAPSHIVEKKKFHFDPAVLELKGDFCLEGSWQSEKYFQDIESLLRQDFHFKQPQTGKNKELAEQMANYEAISLHIRRGDHVSNPYFKKVFGTCPLNYYLKAAKYLVKRLKNPHFFVFSDEPSWAKTNLNLPYPTTFIDHNNQSQKNYEDMRLMSHCRHYIIANSTFSWWAAWLNPNPNKIVIAPKKWVLNEFDAKDIVPDGWIKM